MPAIGSDHSALVDRLISASNSSGGWSYYPGKTSRVEPTAWALLALTGAGTDISSLTAHRLFLAGCQRSDGWLVEHPEWPVNVAFNAFAAFVWANRPQLSGDENVRRLVAAIAGSKGVAVPPAPSFAQDNSLQGWSWTPETFSWVEPTAWGALTLKKALNAGLIADRAAAEARVQEADRLLIDRCCHPGGWNFGNANVMGRDLYAHVPPTAIALLALQDRRDEPAVTRSLEFLESHWADEESLLALGLSKICLRVFGRDTREIETRLVARVHRATANPTSNDGNTPPAMPAISVNGWAVALSALDFSGNEASFRI